MFRTTEPDELRDRIDEFTAPRTRVRSMFTNGQGTLVNEEADADDVRRLITGIIELAFGSLRSSDHGTLRFTVSSSGNDSPFVVEITTSPSASVSKKGQSHEHRR